jgi:MFS family permease
VVDAVADPLTARWSDNYSGRLGHRIPFMLYSGVLYTAVFLALGLSTVITGWLLDYFGKTLEKPLGIQLTGPVAALVTISCIREKQLDLVAATSSTRRCISVA